MSDKGFDYFKGIDSDITLAELSGKIFLFIKKSLLYLVIGAALGGSYGFYKFLTGTPEYEVRLFGYSNALSDDLVSALTDDLNKMIIERDYKLLAKFLNLNENEAASIKGFDVKLNPQIETTMSADAAATGRNFALTVTVTDTALVPKLPATLNYYLHQQPFVQTVDSVFREGYRKMVERIDQELIGLAKTKRLTDSVLASGKADKSMILNIGDISRAALELSKERIQADFEYQVRSKDIVTIKNFVRFSKQTNPRLIKSVTQNGVMGLILGLIGFLVIRRKSKN